MIAGEKYIYLCMAYQLAKTNGGQAIIGDDNGFKGGQKYYRRFNIHQYNGDTLLVEHRTSSAFAEYSRTFKVVEGEKRPYISEYYNESNENCSKSWVH